MQQDSARITDSFEITLDRRRETNDPIGMVGFGTIELFGPDGELKHREEFSNLITDAGDLYYAKKAIVGISPASASAPTAVNGMKLGTGTTAVAKSGAGAALVTYLSGSHQTFDSTYPQTSNLGAGAGVNAVYKTSWAAGEATSSAITECVIVNDEGTDLTTTAANTIARIKFTAIDKGAGDTLAITWNHKFLGA